MLGPALALGIPFLFAIAFFAWTKLSLEGPAAPIVVVDRRTRRLAHKRISEAITAADYARAYAGVTALRLWLTNEVNTGPARHRDEYTAELAKIDAYRLLVTR
jgi:hypothetical protein